MDRKRLVWTGALILFLAVCLGGGYAIRRGQTPKGYQDYTVQKEQYFVEYSEEYDYWDVLTVEYPVLTDIDSEVQERINEQMYETAMDRVNYWHFHPGDEVRAFQEDQFSIFCSDVTADLLTGEVYTLKDILEVNRDFIKLWGKCYCDETGEESWDEEELEVLLSWFLQEDEELKENYESHPFFYVTEDKELVVGITLDPVLYAAITYEPTVKILSTTMKPEDLAPYRTESEFWDRYEKSQTAGEVLPCVDKKENIWLGEGASIWDWNY